MLTNFNKSDIITIAERNVVFLCLKNKLMAVSRVGISNHISFQQPEHCLFYFKEAIMPSGIYVRTEEQKKKTSLVHTGKKLSEETKRKIGLGNKGRKYSEEHKKKLSILHTGKTLSEETKRKLRETRKREKAHNWKGGKTKTIQGYVLVYIPEHPFCDKRGYVLEHRLVMEKILGRYLKPEEISHHRNEIRDDNRPENLRLFASNSDHMKFHHQKGIKFHNNQIKQEGDNKILLIIKTKAKIF